VRTGSFKKKVRKEEREMVRLGTGELPVEAEERRKRKLLCTEDLRLALSLGDGYFGQYPVLAGGVWHARYLDSEGVEDLYNFPAQPLTNGQVWNVQLEFDNGDADGDAMMIESEVMWQGGSVKDVEELDRALDDVLALADL
jgi:transcriptional coactivator HFI1/ADA1